MTTKISKSVGVMRRLHRQLPADVMVKLYYSLVYSHLTYALLVCGRSGLTNAAKFELLTGEHANYSRIITTGSSLFTQFMITLLYYRLSTQILLIIINISKTNYLLINHLICTTPHTEQIVILILHYLIIQKLKNVICTR